MGLPFAHPSVIDITLATGEKNMKLLIAVAL